MLVFMTKIRMSSKHMLFALGSLRNFLRCKGLTIRIVIDAILLSTGGVINVIRHHTNLIMLIKLMFPQLKSGWKQVVQYVTLIVAQATLHKIHKNLTRTRTDFSVKKKTKTSYVDRPTILFMAMVTEYNGLFMRQSGQST